MSYKSKHIGQDVDKAVELVLQNSDKWGSGSSAQIDTTLTKSGQAADAKVVGDKFSKLSEEMLTDAELSNAVDNALAHAKESGEFDGDAGQDGVTPTIGDNGNWYLGDTDTGKPSRGKTGPAGADGKSAYQYAVNGGYTGTEAEFTEKIAEEQLTGTTAELTPRQVYDAVSVGRPVKVQYTDTTYGLISFTAFNVAESLSAIVSQTIAYSNGVCILAELFGDLKGTWSFVTTMLAEGEKLNMLTDRVDAMQAAGYLTLATLPKYEGVAQ